MTAYEEVEAAKREGVFTDRAGRYYHNAIGVDLAYKHAEELDQLRIELSVLNGSSCKEEQTAGNGPCGACVTCLRAENARLRNALRNLTKLARTSAGTAGADAALMQACVAAESTLSA